MASIKAQKIRYDDIGREVSGSAAIVDTIYISTGQKDHSRRETREKLGKVQTPLKPDDSIIKSTNLNFKFPNMWLNHVSDKIQILAFFIPVDDENSIIALRFYNKLTGKKALNKGIDWLGSRANRVVERQDKRIVITQLPKKSGMGTGENLVQADKPIMEYRKRRKAPKSLTMRRRMRSLRCRCMVSSGMTTKNSIGRYGVKERTYAGLAQTYDLPLITGEESKSQKNRLK